jgi:hypothetical protein
MGVSIPLNGYQDIAINNDSCLALTSVSSTVQILDINQIGDNGIAALSAMKILDSSTYSTNRGKIPTYVIAGQGNGEFLVSNMGKRKRR